MTIKETISSLKTSLPERAYFIGRRQPKVTEDLETEDLEVQSPGIVSDDCTVRRWPDWCTRKFFICLGLALAVIAFMVLLGLLLNGKIPDEPAHKALTEAAAQKALNDCVARAHHRG
ncbi:hypothetical protein N7486_009165 [Penicillium sp. IBT 16267x]|nr:hypothetical protein N7486_009165 [Penicillium sp. IBT 16267x]